MEIAESLEYLLELDQQQTEAFKFQKELASLRLNGLQNKVLEQKLLDIQLAWKKFLHTNITQW